MSTTDIPVDVEVLRGEIRKRYTSVVQRAHTDIRQGELVDTYARSTFEDTRRKAAKFGAMGSTIRATTRR